MYHNRLTFIINNMYKFCISGGQSEYCNSVLECTDYEGNLSEGNVLQLLNDHGASYHEYVGNHGRDYHANTLLSWLGY